ncbi:hypothetical protein LTR02_009795 [Friedmanniomyces endolithicus]|nr:hypothetical protein LTR94_017786 [Friedmanniomyces endolithicus]KAK0780916.1 hypothetical protein LTR38_013924 [Friedmanniomyces endolithicus]KAK0782815.1 hypothetical protein LTR59_012032 [Friedmanniomyces endolithicus]KAK0793382.1 hypothetical protein LTR75_011182 [Friedmanniomyces endolithicus]KAK0855729.1 hypothetical protein LTS02_010928 [Friedmanniomyces endolithicus]
MARAVPLWPFLLFGVIEPALLVWAYVLILQDPRKFYIDQVPHSALADAGFPPQAKLLVLLLGNVYLLLAPLAVICIWTPHRRVAVYYLIAVGLGDLGHIYATYSVWGEAFWDLSLWNDMMWGNVGVSAFFHLNRWVTLFGLFGRLGR